MANEMFTPEEIEVLALALKYADGVSLTTEAVVADATGSTVQYMALVTCGIGRDLLTAAKALA